MTNEMAKKGTYVGTGIGLILFVLVGMFPGSLIGGAIGLKISSLMFGASVKATLIPRMIVALSMLAGVLGSAAVFVIGTSVAGWMAGTAVDAVQRAKAGEMEEARAKSH